MPIRVNVYLKFLKNISEKLFIKKVICVIFIVIILAILFASTGSAEMKNFSKVSKACSTKTHLKQSSTQVAAGKCWCDGSVTSLKHINGEKKQEMTWDNQEE